MVQSLANLTDLKCVLQQPGAVVIDFGATWCGPCKFITPKFEALSPKYENVRFYKVNIDEAEDIGAVIKIMGVPTFMFFKDGKMVSEFSGANLNRLVEELNKLSEPEEPRTPSTNSNVSTEAVLGSQDEVGESSEASSYESPDESGEQPAGGPEDDVNSSGTDSVENPSEE